MENKTLQITDLKEINGKNLNINFTKSILGIPGEVYPLDHL